MHAENTEDMSEEHQANTTARRPTAIIHQMFLYNEHILDLHW